MYKEIQNEYVGESVSALSWGNAGTIAVGTLNEKIIIKDQEMKTLKQFKGDMGVIDLAFNMEGTKLAVSCMDYTLKVFGMAEMSEEGNIESNPLNSWKVRFSDRGDTIYTGGDDGQLFEYNFESGELVNDNTLGDHFLSSLTVSGKGHVAVGNNAGDLHVRRGKKDFRLLLTEHNRNIRALEFMADSSKIILASDDMRISVIDLNEGVTVRVFSGHLNLINNLTAHPQTDTFASCSNDTTVKYWDLRAGNCVDSVPSSSKSNVLCLAMNNDGKQIAIGCENGVLSMLSA